MMEQFHRETLLLFIFAAFSTLSGETSFEDYANKLLKAFSEEVKGHPLGHTFMLAGLDFALGPTIQCCFSRRHRDKDTARDACGFKKKLLAKPNRDAVDT